MYEVEGEVPGCDFCQWPCETCGATATECLTCPQGYLLYEVDNTCYEEINYVFPFLGTAVLMFLVVLITDCVKRSTNFLHSILFFFSFLEVGAWGYLIYLWAVGRVEGNRQLTMVSLGVQVLINLVFCAVHYKVMQPNAAPELKQVFKEYKRSSWCIQILAYLFNYKMSLMLISSFAARPRFSGRYNNDSW